MTAGTDTTIHSAGAGYTFGTVNLGNDFIFSDSSLSSSTTLGSGTGGAIEVIISPKDGHGNDAVAELGGHFVMTATTLSQAEGDDLTTANDFRQVGLVVDPTTFGTSSVASATTARQTYVVKGSATSGTFETDEQITQPQLVQWERLWNMIVIEVCYTINKRGSLVLERVQPTVDLLRLVEQTL